MEVVFSEEKDVREFIEIFSDAINRIKIFNDDIPNHINFVLSKPGFATTGKNWKITVKWD